MKQVQIAQDKLYSRIWATDMPRKTNADSESSTPSSSDDSSSDGSSSDSSSSESEQIKVSKRKEKSKKRKQAPSSSSSSSSSSDSDSSDSELKYSKKKAKLSVLARDLDAMDVDENPASAQAHQSSDQPASNSAKISKEEIIDISTLPGWMQRAHVISTSEEIPLADLASTGIISARIVENLKAMGVEFLFPVQTEVIPFVLRGSVAGQDIAVSAPTGSGKTLTYAIPIVHVCKIFSLSLCFSWFL